MAYAQAASRPPKAWAFGQCFGDRDADEEVNEMDVLTAVEFDATGASRRAARGAGP